jgi:diacylglycerol kinase (ATP)
MTAIVILNPYSNRWNARNCWPEAEAALQSAGVEFSVVISEAPRQVIELAEKATREGYSPIIAAGGDGTIGEVVNGMARAVGSDEVAIGPMGILPLGSANDLATSLGIPLDLTLAAKIIKKGHFRSMDIGKVNDYYFANNSAMGLEPYITLIQQRIKGIKGVARYLVAALRGIMDNPRWEVKLEWDDGKYEGPACLVTVGNGPRTGGFYMIPQANFFDHTLGFVHAFRRSRWELLAMLPKTMKPGPGSYIYEPGVFAGQMTWLKVHVETPSPAHADGEIISEAIQDLEYHIQPDRLKILLPVE